MEKTVSSLINARMFARRLAMQAVYQIEMTRQDANIVKKQFHEDESFERADADYFDLLVDASQTHANEIAEKIHAASATKLSRIDPVERAILRNAVYEIIHVDSVDNVVAITEAVRLTKKFGSHDGYRFVNSALHHLITDDKSAAETPHAGDDNSLSEKKIIQSFFTRPHDASVLLGPGDDAALLDVAATKRLACSVNTLVGKVHFSAQMQTATMAHKALAIGLSDLAAMGATPKWVTVALTVPHYERSWFEDFSAGLFKLAEAYKVNVIGGDLTRGDLTITTQVIGDSTDQVMLRAGAQVGDGIYITGNIGGATLAWRHLDYLGTINKDLAAECIRRLCYPEPRVREGGIIARYANAAIAIADGSLTELAKITGDYGAEIQLDRLPLNAACAEFCAEKNDYAAPLLGGGDGELLFAMRPEHESILTARLQENAKMASFTRVGHITEEPDIKIRLNDKPYPLPESFPEQNEILHENDASKGDKPLTKKKGIQSFFTHPSGERESSRLLGLSDNTALLDVSSMERLACATDTLIEDVHFSTEMSAAAIGHKALAVSLSDLAAMGTTPKWTTVALTAPRHDQPWFEDFSTGLFKLAETYDTNIIGLDLTRGKLTITTQVIGTSPDKAMLRTGAQVGDGIYVTGNIGGAALAWKHSDYLNTLNNDLGTECIRRLCYPEPRVREGIMVARYANAAIDISDGLLKDLAEITRDYGAEIQLDRLPLNAACAKFCSQNDDYETPLTGGDDYELLFAMRPEHEDTLAERLRENTDEKMAIFTRIGHITAEPHIRLYLNGEHYPLPQRPGFDHFESK